MLARAGDVLWFYPGDGAGSFGARVQVSTGWSTMSQLFSPGDFSGDGIPDIIARRSTGELRLYEGNGTGGQRTPTTIGTGWNVMNAILSTGGTLMEMERETCWRDARTRVPSGSIPATEPADGCNGNRSPRVGTTEQR